MYGGIEPEYTKGYLFVIWELAMEVEEVVSRWQWMRRRVSLGRVCVARGSVNWIQHGTSSNLVAQKTRK